MTPKSNMPVVRIPRAGTIHEIPTSRFLPDHVRQLASPSSPQDLDVCHFNDPDPTEFSICFYDKTRTMWSSDVAGSIRTLNGAEFDDFAEIQAPGDRIYRPAFFSSASVMSDTICDCAMMVANELAGRGITRAYYDRFKTILQECGFIFCGGAHLNEPEIGFLIRGGARFIEEFKDPSLLSPLSSQMDKLQHRLEGVVIADFLNRKDEKKLIRRELRDTSINERFALLNRVKQVKHLIGCLIAIPPTDIAISTACEIMDDMKKKGIPLGADFLELDSSNPLSKKVIALQAEELFHHTYELTKLYTEEEMEEFIGWLDQA